MKIGKLEFGNWKIVQRGILVDAQILESSLNLLPDMNKIKYKIISAGCYVP